MEGGIVNELAPIERVLVQGDLAVLTPDQRTTYYQRVCESIGVNPLTKPFAYIPLNGKLTLYALKACTEQLRKLHSISVTIASREKLEDIYIVTARATMPDGRCDESIGSVTIAGLNGDALANALMKAETKAKRRVTLSIAGLGMLDESEVATIPGATPVTVTDDGEVLAAPPALPPPSPPSPPAPSKASELEKLIGDARTPAELHAIGKGLVLAYRKNEIGKEQFQELSLMGDLKKSTFQKRGTAA